MKKQNTKYTIVASFFLMLVMAITESIRGILIPTFKVDFNVSDTDIGVFLFLSSLAYVLFTPIAGKVVHKYGQKRTAIVGMSIAGLGFLGASFAQVFSHLVLGYIVLTIGISLIIMCLNTIVPLLKIAYLGVVMNSLHFFYGFGATITQRVAGRLISENISWRTIFLVFSLMYLLAILVYSFVRQPEREDHKKVKSSVKTYEYKLILLFCLALGFYVTAEMQTSNWFLNYLGEVYNYKADQASFYVAFFFGALSIGRLFGGYILEKIGYIRGIIISLTLAFILYSVGLVNENTLILLSISGLFFAIVYPTTILVIQKFFEKNMTIVVTIVMTCASIVSMILGWLIGYLNDNIGVVKSYLLIPASILIALLLTITISLEMKHVKKRRLGE